ncbi:MAG: porin family protein [Alphaproteobacteria bacterium]|nr:porin family protein [Alphaproteobacteria bacterium]
MRLFSWIFHQLLLTVLAVWVFLAFPVAGAVQTQVAQAQGVPSASSSAVAEALSRARSLMDGGRHMDAVGILGPLVQGRVIQADALFLYGLAALEASQQQAGLPDDTRTSLLDQAIASFHAMLVQAPGLVRVRLELARAFFAKGEYGLAGSHFERVLAGDPPDAVAANVRGFLDRIRSRGRWSYKGGFALAPDNNIGGTSNERTIYIFDLPFERDIEELTTSGVGVSAWGGAEYQHPLGEDLRLRSGAEAARRDYKGSRFDQLFVAGHVGPRVFLNRDTHASVLASVQQRWLGSAPDHRALGARVEAGHRVSRSVSVSGRASWHDRRYRVRDGLDGPVWDASLQGRWAVLPTVRLELSGGYGRERPEAERWRHESRWLGAGVSVILPLGFNLGLGGEYRWTDYEGNWFPNVRDGSEREDRTRSLRASVHNRALTLWGFSPELVAVNEERTTNAQLYDYSRTRGELRFVRQF